MSKMSKVYTVSCVYRAPSSGSETIVTKSFVNIEQAAAYAKKTYLSYLSESYYPEEWDGEDMYVDDTRTQHAADPTPELGDKLFAVEMIEKKLAELLKTRGRAPAPALLYGPWSDYQAQRPFEITISATANKA